MKILRSELKQKLEKLENIKHIFRCINCNFSLEKSKIEDAWATHDSKYAWLYIECPICKYQNALWKILKIKRLKI